MQRKHFGAMTALAMTAILALPVLADSTPEDQADYREAVMTAMRGHIGAASAIVRGLIDNDGHLVDHAAALANAAKELDRLFPAGSNVGESEALPLIWEEPEAFAEAIGKLQNATAVFLAAAESGDEAAIGSAFREVGMSCRGCHDRYREEHEH